MFTPAQVLELLAPPASVAAITPSDTTRYDPPLKALSIDAQADVAVLLDGMTSAVTLPAGLLNVGSQHAMLVRKVMATGTGATNIYGWR